MRIHIKRMALAAASVVTLATGADTASAQTVWGTYEQPLEGRRFETMRALAHYLDEAAQDVLAGTVQARRRGTPADRRYITAVRDFARQAESFHTRMDDYSASGFDVPDEVDYLTARARRVNQLVRRGGAYQGTYDDWNTVTDMLGRMRRVLNGEDVEVPAAHDEYGDYDRDYGYLGRGGNADRGTVTTDRTDTYGGTYSGAALTGARLQQFRELAHQLDTSAGQTLTAAERNAPNNDRASGPSCGSGRHPRRPAPLRGAGPQPARPLRCQRGGAPRDRRYRRPPAGGRAPGRPQHAGCPRFLGRVG